MILLSKENCSQCQEFKNFLSFTALGKKHSKDISILVKEKEHPSFEPLLEKALSQGAKSYPILLDENGNVLMTGFNASKAVEILKQLD